MKAIAQTSGYLESCPISISTVRRDNVCVFTETTASRRVSTSLQISVLYLASASDRRFGLYALEVSAYEVIKDEQDLVARKARASYYAPWRQETDGRSSRLYVGFRVYFCDGTAAVSLRRWMSTCCRVVRSKVCIAIRAYAPASKMELYAHLPPILVFLSKRKDSLQQIANKIWILVIECRIFRDEEVYVTY
ncbi:hypothetical protein AB1N83_014053 [Pleurotus pulmonarius]